VAPIAERGSERPPSGITCCPWLLSLLAPCDLTSSLSIIYRACLTCGCAGPSQKAMPSVAADGRGRRLGTPAVAGPDTQSEGIPQIDGLELE
jgi:hypothetical protein